jgi:hypothetical protein
MLRQVVGSIVCVLLPFLYGCGTPSITVKSEYVIKVESLDPAQAEKVRAAVEAIPGVDAGTVRVNSQERTISFKRTDKEGAVKKGTEKKGSEALGKVLAKLEEFGLKVNSWGVSGQAGPN